LEQIPFQSFKNLTRPQLREFTCRQTRHLADDFHTSDLDSCYGFSNMLIRSK